MWSVRVSLKLQVTGKSQFLQDLERTMVGRDTQVDLSIRWQRNRKQAGVADGEGRERWEVRLEARRQASKASSEEAEAWFTVGEAKARAKDLTPPFVSSFFPQRLLLPGTSGQVPGLPGSRRVVNEGGWAAV